MNALAVLQARKSPRLLVRCILAMLREIACCAAVYDCVLRAFYICDVPSTPSFDQRGPALLTYAIALSFLWFYAWKPASFAPTFRELISGRLWDQKLHEVRVLQASMWICGGESWTLKLRDRRARSIARPMDASVCIRMHTHACGSRDVLELQPHRYRERTFANRSQIQNFNQLQPSKFNIKLDVVLR
jgi:hypothetical protein